MNKFLTLTLTLLIAAPIITPAPAQAMSLSAGSLLSGAAITAALGGIILALDGGAQ